MVPFHPIAAQNVSRPFRFARANCVAFGLAAPLLAAPPETPPTFEWATSAAGLKNDKTRCINLDSEGKVFLSGEVTDEAKFGDATIKTAGCNCYVAKFDEKGALHWITQAGGDKGDNACTMVCDAQENVFLGGSFGGTARFDDVSITSAGSNDLYGAKLKAK